MTFAIWAALFGLICGAVWLLAGFYFTTGYYRWAIFYVLAGAFCIYTIYDIGREAGKDDTQTTAAAGRE